MHSFLVCLTALFGLSALVRGSNTLHTLQLAHDESGDCSASERRAIKNSQTLVVSVV